MSSSSHTHCITGTIHAGTPTGTEENIHGLNVYVTGNRASPRAIIVMYTDIFGLLLPNNKLIADALSASGEYLVYMPDFFQGDAVKLNVADLLIPVDPKKQSTLGKYTGLLASAPSFVMWMTRHKVGPTTDVFMKFMANLRKATGKERKIGVVGFCWGGKYAILAGTQKHQLTLSDDGVKLPLVDAVVALHPSNLILPTDVEDPVVPMSFGWGKEDSQVSIKTKDTVEGIHAEAKTAGKKVPEMQHKVYTPGRHGFAVRGNPDDIEEKRCLEDSERQVLEWFGRLL